ncbi:AAEL009329-PA [Aedes aegypti]|uniref:AAEL009329-PA n=1 Tax=Aedes aegypti TaxID=7159 RepID=Q16W67_AEDAE|nr:AAEL009329-PA [Aedes aegypti]
MVSCSGTGNICVPFHPQRYIRGVLLIQSCFRQLVSNLVPGSASVARNPLQSCASFRSHTEQFFHNFIPKISLHVRFDELKTRL